MPIHLPFAVYRFTFKALDRLTIPAYSGTLWHAVVGKALYDSSCIVPQGDCQRCLFAKQCAYPVLFKGVKPADSKIMQRYQTIPPPHIFRIQQSCAYTVDEQQTFTIEVILLGNSNEKLPRLIHAMQKVGENGFHKARKKAQLIQVTQKVPKGLDRYISLQKKEQQLGITTPYLPPNQAPKKLRLILLSPFRPTGDAIQSRTFLVDKLIMAVIRRISLLQYFYTGQTLEADFPALKKHTEQLPVLAHTMQWQRHETLAKRRNQHKQGYAWSGSIDLDLTHHQALWPYLYLGQWLQVGKNASMGFGRYELIDIA